MRRFKPVKRVNWFALRGTDTIYVDSEMSNYTDFCLSGKSHARDKIKPPTIYGS